MKVKYPLFIRDTDSYMCTVSSHEDMNSYLEHIDVEDNEYEGWDVEGRHIELFIEDKEIRVKYISEECDLEAVRRAILHYAKISTKVQFDSKEIDDDLQKLFNAVDEHIKTHREGLIKKIKRLFKRP